MNINSNISLKNRSVVTLSGFKGLDTLSSSVNVSAIHATEIENLISRDGVNHKRYGWKTQLRIRDYDNQNKGFFPKIQGIFEFNIFTTKFIFAYANKKFWWIDLDKGTYININNQSLFLGEGNELNYVPKGKQTVAPLKEGFLRDQQCKCFQNGNKVYFIGCGDYLVFSRWGNNRFEIRRVIGNEDVYIPTTTENIGWEGMTNPPKRITAEERNILSAYNKNTLIGPDQLGSNKSIRYYLDTKDFTDIEVEIKNKNGNLIRLTKGVGGQQYEENDEINVLEIVTEPFSLMKEYDNGNVIVASLDSIRLGEFKLKETDIEETYSILLMFTPLSWKEDTTYNFTLKTIEYAELKVVAYKWDGNYGIDEYIIKNIRLQSNLSYFDDSKVQITYEADLGKFCVDLTDKHIIFKSAEDFVKLYNPKYNLIYEGDLTGYIYATYNPSEGFIDFYGRGDDYFFSPQVAYKPNIIVKMKTEEVEYFTFNGIAREFGLQGATDRLFIVENNFVRWSKDEDFTYFGEKSWCACGTPDKKIIGMERLNDNTLLLVKEYSAKDHSIFAITGNLVTKQTEGNTVDYLSLFSARGYQVGEGAVGGIVSFNGECLMIARDGFYAISLGENVAVDQRYVVHRSKQISNELSNFELREAKCVAYDGKFYACVEKNDKYYVYVADSKYLVNFENSTQYEWWRWSNIPVSAWGFVNNELWFGTDDGQICCFTKEFYDESMTKLEDGLISYNATENDITDFNIYERINIENGDLIIFNCDMWGKVETDFDIVNGKTIYNLPLKDYQRDTHFYYVIDNEVIQKEITRTELGIEIDGKHGGVFYKNYKNTPLTVKIEDGKIYLQKNNKNVEWLKKICTGNDKLVATLKTEKTIIAKWKSGAMDLGTRVYAKTITGFSLTGEKDLANRLKYKIHHRLGREDYEHFRANNDLDLEGVDLQTISLDSNFASTYSKKLNIRNVNFVQLELEQDTREDMAINSVQLEFKLCKKNIGVR